MNDLFSISTKSNFNILNRLSRDSNAHITKSYGGCGAVLLNETDYNKRVYNIIKDSNKCEKINIEGKKLLIKLEDILDNAL